MKQIHIINTLIKLLNSQFREMSVSKIHDNIVSCYGLQIRPIGTGTSITELIYCLTIFDKINCIRVEEFKSLPELRKYIRKHDITLPIKLELYFDIL